MCEPLRLSVPCTSEAVVRAMNAIEQYLEENEAGPGLSYAAQLAFEELATNIVKYGGLPAGAPNFAAVLELGAAPNLVLTDAGHPFDPWHDAPRPDLAAALEDRPIGGLGLHMVRQLAAAVAYERRDEQNIVTVTFAPEDPA